MRAAAYDLRLSAATATQLFFVIALCRLLQQWRLHTFGVPYSSSAGQFRYKVRYNNLLELYALCLQ